ncbi:MAG: PTS transporter subunit EIIC [Erysipelotrichaceae bacterium]|nr:PTS transporter subunit EIIC [Erysipelotrichaceae bacterium]
MKNKKTILLICANGASTGLFAERMKKGLHDNEQWVIEAKPVSELPLVVAKYDMILIAPQIGYERSRIWELAAPYGDIDIMEIDPDDFAKGRTEKILDQIRSLNGGPEDCMTLHDDERGIQMSETAGKKSFMDKMSDWMQKFIVPIGMKISNQRHLAAIRDGLTILIPATIIGGIACLIAIPPIPSTITEPSNFFYAFLLAWKSFAAANSSVLMIPYYMTIGVIAIYVVCGVAYELAKSYKMDGINNMVAALLVYLCVSGAVNLETVSLTISKLGAAYMFSAMIVAIITVEINRFFAKHNIVIKLPDSVPPNVAAPFNVLLPLGFTVIAMLLIDSGLTAWTGAGFASLIYTVFQPLMSATGSLPSVLLINFLMTTFWFFGIHGANMLSVVTTPITTAALAANAEAIVNGTTPPYIYAGAMNSVFGNWITYNVILLVIFLWCKSSQARSIAKVAIVPSLFNINEPTIFGLPTVLNVYTYIPLLLCGMLNTAAYYLCASANLVGRFYITLPFTVPGPLQAFLGTGDVKTIVLWIILFLCDIPLVYPFIKTYDKQLLAQEKENAEKAAETN